MIILLPNREIAEVNEEAGAASEEATCQVEKSWRRLKARRWEERSTRREKER